MKKLVLLVLLYSLNELMKNGNHEGAMNVTKKVIAEAEKS